MAEENPQSYPQLEVLTGPEEGLILSLRAGSQKIGRSKSQADHVLGDSSISRIHIEILHDQGGTLIKDLHSRNGTWINQKKLEAGSERKLEHLDRIQIGIYEIRFVDRPLTPEDLELEKEKIEENAPEENQDEGDKTESGVDGNNNPLSDDPDKDEADSSNNSDENKEKDSNESEDKSDGEDLDDSDDLESEDDKEVSQKAMILHPHANEDDDSVGKRLMIVFLILCLISAIAGASYFAYKKYQEAQKVQELELEFSSNDEKDSTPITNDENDEQDLTESNNPPSTSDSNPNPNPNPKNSSESKPDTTLDNSPQPTEIKPQEKTDLPEVEVKETQEPKAPTIPVKPLKPLDKSDLESQKQRIYLDIRTEPTTALIQFEGKEIGRSPLKYPVELIPGQQYMLLAEFELKDIGDRYQQKVLFTPEAGKDIQDVRIESDIGTVKVLKLPRGIEFYLEGYYAYDRLKAHPVKLTDIVYGKPFYVPFGDYTIELREKVRVGESQTFVDEIRYHREFTLDENRRTVEISINEQQLQFFPVKILSQPKGATLYLNGEEKGKTPFKGEFPLGKHEIKLTREGYFDYVTSIDMRTNTPFEADVRMKTSKVGEILEKVFELRRKQRFKQAIDELIQGLKYGGSEREIAQVHYYLGLSYLDLKNYSQAYSSFGRAKQHPDFYYEALLGLAQSGHYLGKKDQALLLVAEILLNVPTNDPIRNKTKAFFHEISPIRSVVYLSTQPSGARVFVNNQEIEQTTPMLIPNLPLANHRFEIRKPGFETQVVKKNITISDFVPLHIVLKPEEI